MNEAFPNLFVFTQYQSDHYIIIIPYIIVLNVARHVDYQLSYGKLHMIDLLHQSFTHHMCVWLLHPQECTIGTIIAIK